MKPQDTTKKAQHDTARHHKTQQIWHKIAQIRNKNKLQNSTNKILDTSRHQK